MTGPIRILELPVEEIEAREWARLTVVGCKTIRRSEIPVSFIARF